MLVFLFIMPIADAARSNALFPYPSITSGIIAVSPPIIGVADSLEPLANPLVISFNSKGLFFFSAI